MLKLIINQNRSGDKEERNDKLRNTKGFAHAQPPGLYAIEIFKCLNGLVL